MGFCECEFTSNLPGQKLQPFNNFNWKLSTTIYLNAPASVVTFIFLFARFLCSTDFPSPVCVCGIWDAIIKKCSMFNKCVVTRERSSYDKLYAIDDVPTNANVCVCMGMTRLKYNHQPNVFFIRLFILILTFFFSRKDLIIFKGNINGWAHSTPSFYIFCLKILSVIKDDAEAWARSNEAKLT